MFDAIQRDFLSLAPAVDFCSLRIVDECQEKLSVRHGIVQPIQHLHDAGLMVMVHHGGGMGYGATSDCSKEGIKRAISAAKNWATVSAQSAVTNFSNIAMPALQGTYQTSSRQPWRMGSLRHQLDYLQTVAAVFKQSNAYIVDSLAALSHLTSKSIYMTADGAKIEQSLEALIPHLSATAHRNGKTQIRTLTDRAMQGGGELLEQLQLQNTAKQLSEQAVALLDAEPCPQETMDVLLAPDQMMLQIHESIGHPIELDRILGDERNYAGQSFVTLDMFGSYQYGSPILNVSFDPSIEKEFATYGFDDDGAAATKTMIIKDGILQRPLGGTISSARASVITGANSTRASSWSRPPIDRMANLNIEPGNQSLEQLIGQVERGIYMQANRSWSIDDSRNNFQFGCEMGHLIENGKLTKLVKTPGYRGISATFWRNLKAVGDQSTFAVHGTPYCGKGEPNQIIRVGHASPACLFSNVEVF